MNYTLQKEAGFTEEERIARRRGSAKMYMKRHQTMCVTLNKEDDKEIIEWLEKQENRSESIRKALKLFIKLQDSLLEVKMVEFNGNKGN